MSKSLADAPATGAGARGGSVIGNGGGVQDAAEGARDTDEDVELGTVIYMSDAASRLKRERAVERLAMLAEQSSRRQQQRLGRNSIRTEAEILHPASADASLDAPSERAPTVSAAHTDAVAGTRSKVASASPSGPAAAAADSDAAGVGAPRSVRDPIRLESFADSKPFAAIVSLFVLFFTGFIMRT
jgi:hypothetical protein